MPRIEIETNVVDSSFEKRLAKAASLWLHKQGVPINHSITKFRTLEPSRVFSGPFPFDGFPGSTKTTRNFAFVDCVVSRDRSLEFKRELTAVLVDAARPDVSPEYVFVSFRAVTIEDHINGDSVSKSVRKEA